MKLCLIANPNSIHTRRWVNYFYQRNYEVHLIGEKPTTYIPPDGVKFYDLTQMATIRKVRYAQWVPIVRRLVRAIRPDLLHAHQVASAGWLGAAAGYHPFLLTSWGSDLLVGPQRSWVHYLLARWVIGRADYMTCVAKNLIEAALKLGANPKRLEFAPWGIDTSIYHAEDETTRATLRRRYGLTEGPVVLSIRALSDTYNPLDIAQAIPKVLAQAPTAQFIMRTYGCDPDLYTAFQQIVADHKAADAVHYVGDLSNEHEVAALYQAADVALSVPSSDGTPSSVLESLSCGAVPILSDLPSLRDWIQHEREGLFVPVHDVEAISQAILRLIKDATLQQNLRQQGIELVQQRADSKVWMLRSEAIYAEIARKNPV